MFASKKCCAGVVNPDVVASIAFVAFAAVFTP